MNTMIKAALSVGVLKDFPPLLSPKEAQNLSREQLLVLASGSQGEGRAASAQLARDSYMGVSIAEGDLFLFSSKTIPGNEKKVSAIINKLEDRGAIVIDDSSEKYHVSGHANRPDLEKLHDLLKPNLVIPMHGELRHLNAHSRLLASKQINSLVALNGDIVEIKLDKPARIKGKVNVGLLFLDGEVLHEKEEGVVHDRLKLAQKGHAIISLLITNNRYDNIDLEVEFIGVPVGNDTGDALIKTLKHEILLKYNSANSRQKLNEDAIETICRRQVNQFFKSETGKKPVVSVFVHNAN